MVISRQDGSEVRWVPATYCASPNFDDRPDDTTVDLLVIHCISLPPGEFGGDHIRQLFTNELDCRCRPEYESLKGLKVSAHCLIDRLGGVTQFVDFDKRAWHAGRSHWQGREACNDFSIGIELEGCDTKPYTDAQYRTLAALTADIRCHYPAITEDRVVGHSDIAPARKTDPGPHFDWQRLREAMAA